MDYDVLILGGGIIGCAVAYELSRYSLNIALIEKDYDIADDVALINTAIIYDGVESEDALMARLEIMGNSMFDELAEKFNIPFRRCGTYTIAEGRKSELEIDNMLERAKARGIKEVELIDSNELYKKEPNLNCRVQKAIYSKNTGIICPYDLAISYGEVAFDNGVNFRLEEEVLDIQRISRGLKVTTNKNKITCRMVVNTTPGDKFNVGAGKSEDESKSRCLNYMLLDKNFKGSFLNILNVIKEDGDNIISFETLHGNMLAGVSSSDFIDSSGTIKRATALVAGLSGENMDSFYQSTDDEETILIDDSYISKGYISIKGKHYGQVTMSPAIAKLVCETIVANINCVAKKDFVDKRREVFRFKGLSKEEQNNLIAMDRRYGKIICLCQQITEGEIVDSIRRPLGARTVEGVKRRTGVTFGNCQGSHCLSRIISILSRETNKDLTEIVKDSKNSTMLPSRIKEFDSI
jgi:L-2-hydroxyglutarate oxidase LhgO